jgi:Uma2 family endonuclease
MAEPATRLRMSRQEYLAFERAAPERHEYLDGEVVAMAGGRREHSLIGNNLGAELRSALRGRPCEVYNSDLRVWIDAADLYTYPDVAVVCGEPAFEDERRDILLNPTAVVEVLSDSTESYDRGEKFGYYRTLPSLTDYLLASQKRPLVEHFSRQPEGGWLLRTYGPGERLALPSLGCEIPVDEIYLKVFAAAPA